MQNIPFNCCTIKNALQIWIENYEVNKAKERSRLSDKLAFHYFIYELYEWHS